MVNSEALQLKIRFKYLRLLQVFRRSQPSTHPARSGVSASVSDTSTVPADSVSPASLMIWRGKRESFGQLREARASYDRKSANSEL